MHHADAVGPDVDPQRPLSSRGLAQAGALASAARERGVKPDVIWHSGKLRARQTAEFYLRACNPMADFRMVRGLRPEDPPEWMRDELAAETRQVLLAGHMPHMSSLLSMLAPGAAPFPTHGAVALERSADGAWKEVRRGE